MAKKVTIKETPTDTRLEEEAAKNRIKPKYKSGTRGPRDFKLTVLVPKSLNEDMKILANVLDRSTGDIINEYLEQYVKQHEDKIKKFKKALESSRD